MSCIALLSDLYQAFPPDIRVHYSTDARISPTLTFVIMSKHSHLSFRQEDDSLSRP